MNGTCLYNFHGRTVVLLFIWCWGLNLGLPGCQTGVILRSNLSSTRLEDGERGLGPA